MRDRDRTLRGYVRRAVLLFMLGVTVACGNVPPSDTDAGRPVVDAGAGPGPLPQGGCLDNDGDGVGGTGDCEAVPVPDCDDADPLRAPGRAEVCDGLDNDCDGQIDEELPLIAHYVDADGDGYGTGVPVESCHAQLPDRVSKGGDCDDQNPLRYPGAPEACNQLDDDCNGTVDDNITDKSFFDDLDGDGWGAGAATKSCQASLPGKVTRSGDCNDGDPNIHPGAAELCNGVDDNCDSRIDDSFPTRGDACQTGLSGPCAPGTIQCVSGAPRCVGAVQPMTEVCDGADNDCDGSIDETFTNKGGACSVGQGACANSGTWVCSADKSTTQCSANPASPGAPACDGVDNDCDGTIDEPELVKWSSVASSFEPTDMAVAPFFFTLGGCNGGQNAFGTDAWADYFVAYVRGGDLFAQKLDEDGHPLSTVPLDLSNFTSNQEVSMAQAGPGLAVVTYYRSGSNTLHDLDLYAFGPGMTKWTNEGTSYRNLYRAPSGATLSNIRVVRGNGGRVVLLWRETSGSTSKIRMARFSLNVLGATFTVTVQTAPMDLITVLGSTGAFGVASSHPTWGDQLACSAGLARFAVAHQVDAANHEVRLDVFNEDGTATGASWMVFSSGTAVPSEPEVAWAPVGGDRWGVVHTLAWDFASEQYERVNFWHSGLSRQSDPFGPNQRGNGLDSVRQLRITARTSEFLVSMLAFGLSSASTEPQVWVGKVGHDGTTVQEPQKVTVASGCSGPNCANGIRRVVRPLASSSGVNQTPGVVLMTGSSGAVHAGVLGCN